MLSAEEALRLEELKGKAELSFEERAELASLQGKDGGAAGEPEVKEPKAPQAQGAKPKGKKAPKVSGVKGAKAPEVMAPKAPEVTVEVTGSVIAEDRLVGERLAPAIEELAVKGEEQSAEQNKPPFDKSGASHVVTIRDSKAVKVWFRDGKEIGVE